MVVPAHLVILPPAGEAHSAPLRTQAELGSGAAAAIRVADPEVASEHAVFVPDDGGWVLEPHKPLLVNGREVKRHRLRPSDLITLGRTAIAFRLGAPQASEDRLGMSAFELCQRLNQFSSRLVAGATADELTRWFLADVLALTEGDHGALVRFAGVDAQTLGLVDAATGRFSEAEATLSSTVIARLRDEDRSLLLRNVTADADLGRAPSIVKSDIAEVMCAPIRHGGKMAGALYVSTRSPGAFSKASLELVTVYAGHAAHLLGAAQRDRALVERLGRAGQPASAASSLVGSSPSIRQLRQQIEKVARHDIGVLILGPTGAGKEVAARELHRLSARADGPFVAVNCGAIPEALLQSELFGHTEGAFTNAMNARVGWIRSADGGTLFLDEIGEMPAAQQAMLLRVLQDRLVTPVGSDKGHPVDFRLLCATHRDLRDHVAAGSFREDLYYRIADVLVEVPPLSARGDDAVELAQHFLRLQREAVGRPTLRLSAAAMSAIRGAPWPGNVRELASRVRRGALLCEGDAIEPSDLALDDAQRAAHVAAASDEIQPLSAARDAYLKRYVTEVVERKGGNRTEAAKALGVSVRTVFKYLEQV